MFLVEMWLVAASIMAFVCFVFALICLIMIGAGDEDDNTRGAAIFLLCGIPGSLLWPLGLLWLLWQAGVGVKRLITNT